VVEDLLEEQMLEQNHLVSEKTGAEVVEVEVEVVTKCDKKIIIYLQRSTYC
jgi:hypothetical protein